MFATGSFSAARQAPPPAPRPEALSCRPIDEEDLPSIADLLAEGFPRRGRAAWGAALHRLRTHRAPDGFPRFGYMLDQARTAVGVLLLISARLPADGADAVRSNVSSWYVRPEHRLYAPLLVTRARRLRADSFVNISPAESTWRIIEAQGFRRFNAGVVAAVPLARLSSGSGEAVPADGCAPGEPGLAPGERRLLEDHADFGCVSFCCRFEGKLRPFVFRRRLVDRVPLPGAQLIYCQDIADLARCAGPIGRFLGRRGMGWILAASDERIPGLPGKVFPSRAPMYYAGSGPPRPGDLAYTEAALFGV